MPNYKRPGVYLDESLTPLVATFAVPGVSPSAFVGAAIQGPTVPTTITSWSQYQSLFGGFGDGSNYLPFAVYQFFTNGGNNCYVVRAARSDAATASVTFNNRAGTPAPLLRLVAKNPGAWGNTVFLDVADSGVAGSGRVDITVRLGGTSDAFIVERWVDTSMNPGDSRYLISLINAPVSGSSYLTAINLRAAGSTSTLTTASIIGATALVVASSASFVVGQTVTLEPNVANAETVTITAIPDATHLTVSATTKAHAIGTTVTSGVTYAVTDTPAVIAAAPLTGGSEGAAAYNYVAAAQTLSSIEDNVNLNVPGVNDSATINALITWAEAQGNIFLVIDVPQAAPGAAPATTATTYAALGTGGTAFTASSYAAIYGPWLLVDDPASSVPGAIRALPPGGAVLGKYVNTDATRNVAKPPAGIGARIVGILGVETVFANADLDTLNVSNVNMIRPVPGNGYCIMGARTLKSGFPDRYVSIRRTLMSIKKSLVDGTRFAIFEPNTPGLWATLEVATTQYLTSLMQLGILKGNTPNEAFYVKCDDDTNPPDRVASGEVHLEVGVALQTPAEFIVIKIGQYEGTGQAVASV